MLLHELSLAEHVSLVGRFNPRTGAEMQPGMFSEGNIYLAEAADAFIELSDLDCLTVTKVHSSKPEKGQERTELFVSPLAERHPVRSSPILSYAYDLVEEQSVPRTAQWYLTRFSARKLSARLEDSGLVNRRGGIIRHSALSEAGWRLYGEARAELDSFVEPGSPLRAEEVSERTRLLGAVLRCGEVWKPVFPGESHARRVEILDRILELKQYVTSEGEGHRRRSLLLSELAASHIHTAH